MKPTTTTATSISFRITVSLLVLLPVALVAFLFLVLYPNEFRLQSLVTSGCLRSPNAAFVDLAGPVSTPGENDDLRILIGILTRADLYYRRNLLRLAYSVQPAPVRARVDVRFILCRLYKEEQRTLVPLEILAHNDAIVLDCPENMDEGKTYTYFSSLPRLFNNGSDDRRPYDYVMKVDDDTYIRTRELAESLRPLPRDDMYYGAAIPCGSKDPFQEYMTGMAYGLSWDLVEWIATSEIARNLSIGTEDMMTGAWLREGKKAKNRYDMRAVMYDFPVPHPTDMCSHELVRDSIAVHKLKDDLRWALTLDYFNVTRGLKSSKFYNFG